MHYANLNCKRKR